MNLLGEMMTIDLSTGVVTTTTLDETVARRYLGGRGLNAWQMRRLVGPEVDAYDPENALILGCGLVTGTEFPSSSRLQLAARSPQTNLLGSSNVGGHFGAALRGAGYQAIRIVGRADRPVYVWIDANGAEIRDAAHLWGLETQDVSPALGFEHEAWVMSIGVAGENLVRFASILTSDDHAAGRTGLGAVMGSKRLKAIAIARHQPDRKERNGTVAALARRYALNIRQSERYELYSTYSNGAYLTWTNDLGMLGTRNFQTAQFEHADRLNGTGFMRYVTRHKTCHRCPVHCRAEIRIDHGRYARLLGSRPDIEPLMAFGPRIGVDDLEAVLYLYNLTNQLGLDVISTAGVLAFAIELFERGILTPEDTGGLALRWGDVEAAVTLTHQIAQRAGFGQVLAEGVRRAAQLIGRDAEQYAHHSKGLELPGYDPRGAQGTALSFAISNRGADYASVYPSLEFFWTPEQARQALGTEKAVDPRSPAGKGALVRYAYIVSAVLDALGVCKVPILSVVGDFSLEPEAELASALTGWDLTPARLFEIGSRIVTVERLLNLSYGMSHHDDVLPDMFLKIPLASGPTKGQTVALAEMVRDFYAAMGWDNKGQPPGDIDF
jgi:aldehyde:ferredoxin oxidoreductase